MKSNKKKIAALLIFISLISFGQTTSPELVIKKMANLYKDGKLDSLEVPITSFKDGFDRIDSTKKVFIYRDTIKYTNGSFAIGRVIIDPYMELEGRKIGQWIFYYPSKKMFAKGSFSVGVYTECQSSGPSIIGYSYKTGKWNYFYEGNILMAEGVYELKQVVKNTNCGNDIVNEAVITSNWDLYEETGIKSNNANLIISKIETAYD